MSTWTVPGMLEDTASVQVGNRAVYVEIVAEGKSVVGMLNPTNAVELAALLVRAAHEAIPPNRGAS